MTKIVSLISENVKKIRAIEITPTGEIVTISGKNGQGKTSVLDSIWWALAGSSNIQKQPIRKGQTKARVRLDLGDIIVERRFTETGNTLTVENKDGARFPSPQKLLDKLLGELSFDPLAFARMEPRKQFDELRRVSKLDIDIDQLDGLTRSDYAKRTDLNRDAKTRRAQAEAIIISDALPAEPFDEDELLTKLQQAGEHNTGIEQERAKRQQAQRDVTDLKARGELLHTSAAKMREAADAEYKRAGEAAAAAYKKACDDASAALARALGDVERAVSQAAAKLKDAAEKEAVIAEAAPLPDPINTNTLRAEVDSAKRINQQIAERGRRASITSEAEALESQARALTEQMEARERVKQEAIARAAMPVEGLGFGDGVVTYQGVPFEQASSAEQLRVSLGIAIAANPKLKVIRIQDGSLLDVESLAQIAEMAKAHDTQVWLERVDDSGKIGIVIADGEVESTPESRAAATEGATA